MKKILVVVAHPDDEVLGCGGTLLKHNKNGDEVNVFFMTDGESSRESKNISYRKKQASEVCKQISCNKSFFNNFPDNSMDTIPLLEIAKKVEETIRIVKPDIIYSHHLDDLNVDHQLTAKSVLTATRPMTDTFVSEINCFEILSSTHYLSGTAYDTFSPNYFIDISAEISEKINLMSIYKKELQAYPNPRSKKGIEVLSNYRGMQVGLKNAEAFIQVRKLSK